MGKHVEHSLEGERVGPCPFCRGLNLLLIEQTDGEPLFWYVACTRDQVAGPLANTRPQAIELWNQASRPDYPAM
jgi:hypothetical protein